MKTEIEIRRDGEVTFYVSFEGNPTDENYDEATAKVTLGSEDVLREAMFFAALVEAGK